MVPGDAVGQKLAHGAKTPLRHARPMGGMIHPLLTASQTRLGFLRVLAQIVQQTGDFSRFFAAKYGGKSWRDHPYA